MSEYDHDALRAEIRALAEATIAPNAERTDGADGETGRFPRENLRALADAGWNGVLTSPEFGGRGLDHVAFAIAAEEIGRVDASTGLIYVMHVGAAQTLNLFGNDDQRRRWLGDGSLIGTYSTSERATGGHWWFNLSEASRDGDDYVVNADKSFTTSSGEADFYVVQTRTPGAAGPKDITFFIVDGVAPGITPGPWSALGVRGNSSGPISYRDVKVPARDRLGQENQGKDIVYHGVSPVYLIGLGAVWHGVARGALERSADWLTGTIHRDYDRRLSDYQVLRQALGRAKVLVSSLAPWQESLARRLDELWRAGEPQGQILLPLTEFKIHAAEVAAEVTTISLDVSGGYGYRRGALERAFRDARAGVVMGPSNNIAREWLGKQLVGLPLELFEQGGE